MAADLSAFSSEYREAREKFLDVAGAAAVLEQSAEFLERGVRGISAS